MICASLPAHEEKVRDICVWTPPAPASNVTQGPRNARIGRIAKTKGEQQLQHNALMELYVDELKDLYDAENRLVKAIPKMTKAGPPESLGSGFRKNLGRTAGT